MPAKPNNLFQRTHDGANQHSLDLEMTLQELEEQLRSAKFFSQCGQFRKVPGAVPIQSAIGWDWLPTSRDQPDPVYRLDHFEKLEKAGLSTERRAAELFLAKAVLVGQRSTPAPGIFIEGPVNYAQAALGGAQFAARMAAREVVLGQSGFWCKAVEFYIAGYWPCGILSNLDLVVY